MPDARPAIPSEPARLRSLFISDVHLGTRACRAESLLEMLAAFEVERIYLVGDIVDGWRLKARWHWPKSHDAVVRYLLAKQHAGTRILYIPGNHDEFLLGTVGLHLGGIDVVDHAVHQTRDGQRYLVVHGDQFDPVVRRMRRLAAFGIWIYSASVLAHDGIARLRSRLGWVKRRGNDARFIRQAVQAARHRGLDGVICGHLHRPAMHDVAGLTYINTGDWVSSCTALVEHHDGRMEMLTWPEAPRSVPTPATARWEDLIARPSLADNAAG